ncbi:TPM domain-containing protein [Aquihabitans sp. G128]|uniref:TPM domain-containing protein n=1 Tax=Aquihabitans sp. G128 TaxID=2849779 RepID=UPI001C21C349|nr:TPM domain-containing protein [Aquihabitans sp. G128]QXC61897.1 TPM domain-containing protein [Aquihabitans sp. G128]
MPLVTKHRHRSSGRTSLLVALAVGLSAGLGVGVGAGPAAAQDPATTTTVAAPVVPGPVDDGCDDLVHDERTDAAAPVGQDVVGLALRLAAAGTEAHVRLVSTVPTSGAIAELEQRCRWLGDDGRRATRGLELFLGPTGSGAVRYGAELRPRLGARFPAVLERTGDRLGVLQGVLGLVVADPPKDPLGCDQLVWDPAGELGDDPAVEDAAFAFQDEGADVRVRVEGPTDGDIDARQRDLEAACPGWTVGGDRPANRVLVMVQPSARTTGLWYGADWASDLEGRWEAVQEDVMNPRFRAGDVAGGLAAGLAELRQPSYRSSPAVDFGDTPSASQERSASSSSSGSFPVGWMLLLVVAALASWGFSYLSWKAKFDAGETEESFGEYSRRRSGGRRGWGGSGGFGGGGFGGGGGHASGGGSGGGGGGHSGGSGGGSTSW